MFELKNAEPVHVIHWESIANDCYYGKCDWCNALFCTTIIKCVGKTI